MPRNKKTSAILRDIIASCEGQGPMTVEQFLGKMGSRVHALAIFVLAIATVVAGAIPGFSTIMALPIIFIALQMVVGRTTVWLPKNIREKTISAEQITNSLSRALPTLKWVERLLKPRLTFITSPIAQRILALLIVGLALLLAMPIPGGNLLPSFTISLLGLAILERDGVLVIATLSILGFMAHIMLSFVLQGVHFLSSLF